MQHVQVRASQPGSHETLIKINLKLRWGKKVQYVKIFAS